MSQVFRVLIIDDDHQMRSSLVDLIEAAGWVAKPLARATEAERWIGQFTPDVILSDVRMPGMTGLELLAQIKNGPPFVLISAHGDIQMAVEAMNMGAYSFVEKPYDPKRLLTILSHAAEQFQMRESNRRLRQRLQEISGLRRVMIGETTAISQLRESIALMADSAASVLIQGETGTGKELVAHALHDLSHRCERPFIAVNAAQFLVDQLPQIARSAAGGTLFFDEICACPLAVQPALLRLIETKEILDPDQGTPEQIDLRIVAATNEDTGQAVTNGHLRADLLYRVQTLDITLPPLRERLDDVPLLATRFLHQFATVYQVPPPELTDAEISALLAHRWPGNVRELKALMERHVLSALSGQGRILDAFASERQDRPGLREAIAAFERQMISREITAQEGRMDDVADALRIGRRTLNEKIVKLGLDKDDLI